MILLLDSDVLIDFAIKRRPFYEEAKDLFRILESNKGVGHLAWHSVANFYYLVRPKFGNADTKLLISELLRFIDIAQVGTKDLNLALSLFSISDFEDSMQVASAIACGANYIVTRNTKHYKNSPINAVPPQFVNKMF